MGSSGIDGWLGRTDLTTGEHQYLHRDGINSTVALTDAVGQVVERYTYTAYGQMEVLTPDSTTTYAQSSQPYTYTSHEWESAANLYYYRARFYSPQMGRFVSMDPTGFADGSNLFGYVSDNPLRSIDPLGLSSLPVDVLLQDQLDHAGVVDSDEVSSRRAFLVPDDDLNSPRGIDAPGMRRAAELTADANDVIFISSSFSDAAADANNWAVKNDLGFDEVVVGLSLAENMCHLMGPD